jgi:hypothetical protein
MPVDAALVDGVLDPDFFDPLLHAAAITATNMNTMTPLLTEETLRLRSRQTCSLRRTVKAHTRFSARHRR